MLNLNTNLDFGTFEFHDIDGMLSYDCKVVVPELRKPLEVSFETNSANRLPSVAQKQFLQQLFSDFEKVLSAVAAGMPAEFGSNPVDRLRVLKDQFDPGTPGISLDTELNLTWDISFRKRSDRSTSLLASFAGLTPRKVWVEKASKRPFLLRLFLRIKQK